jgi:non-ribosomal peptide synthetase component F
MNPFGLSPFQLLFLNQEISSGTSESNVLRGKAVLRGKVDWEGLRKAVESVLERSLWTRLSIDPDTGKWVMGEELNGRFSQDKIQGSISATGTLWSVALVQTQPNAGELVLHLHHCLGDAHSFTLFWNDVLSIYQGEQPDLEKRIFFAETDPPTPLKHGLNTHFEQVGLGAVVRLGYEIRPHRLQKLREHATRLGVSVTGYLLERLQSTLKSMEQDLEMPLRIGMAVRNRKTKAEKDSFLTQVNFLPLSTNTEEAMDSRVKRLFRSQDYPLIKLLEDNHIDRAFNVLFSYQKEEYDRADQTGFSAEIVFEPSALDENILGIHLLEYGDGNLTVHLDHRTDLASRFYWKSIFRHLVRCITAEVTGSSSKRLVLKPSVLEPQIQHATDFGAGFSSAPDEKIALWISGVSYTFQDIRARVLEHGQSLEKSPRPYEVVRLQVERTLENIVSLLSAWQLGRPVTYHELGDPMLLEEGSTAYVAMTTGTSGANKKVLVRFDGLKSLIGSWQVRFETIGSVHLSLADQRFDVFFGDVLRSLMSGETLVLATEEERLDASRIADLISRHGVTHLESTPSFLQYLVPYLSKETTLKVLICGSEPIKYGFFNWMQSEIPPQTKVFNSYGLTECSIDTAACELKPSPDGRFPVGYPLGDQKISIRTPDKNIKPMGAIGEICIEGTCVGTILDGESSAGIYYTGDLGTICPEEGLTVLGRRSDDMVKVNGRRIPARFIENKASEVMGHVPCVCLAHQQRVILFANGTFDRGKLLSELGKYLSKYQMPDEVFFSKIWPLNQNGKVDRKKLCEFYDQSCKIYIAWEPDGTERERMIHNCLGKIGKPFGAAHESLIAHGWNSIDLLKLSNELNINRMPVPVASFLQHPTIQFVLDQDPLSPSVAQRDAKVDSYDIDDILSVLNDLDLP